MPWHFDNDTLRLRKLCVGPMENNAYLVACARTSAAVVIDAAAEPDRILAAATELRLEAILTTHGHHDHIQAVPAVRADLGIPFRLHGADAVIAGIEPDQPITDNEEIAVGDLRLLARHTPGHTPGSVTYYVEGHAFTGDTLFPGGPGATHFQYGDHNLIRRSISERILPLPDDTLLHPGHGLDSTIGAERPGAPWT